MATMIDSIVVASSERQQVVSPEIIPPTDDITQLTTPSTESHKVSEKTITYEEDAEESPEDILFLLQLEQNDKDNMESIRLQAHQALEDRLSKKDGKKINSDKIAADIAAARQASSCDVHHMGEKIKDVKQIKVNLGYGAKKRVKP
jgi:hypothetical protein